jgi:hypothetical protein
MGYLLNALGNLPIDDSVSLYIFVINGEWSGGRYEVLERNFSRIAQGIGSNAVIAKGFDEEFYAEVARTYLGKDHRELSRLLPAVLITDTHPAKLTDNSMRLLIPLGEAELRFGDLETFFRELTDFALHRDTSFLERFETKTDWVSVFNDVVSLRPGALGIGINVNEIIKRLRPKKV